MIVNTKLYKSEPHANKWTSEYWYHSNIKVSPDLNNIGMDPNDPEGFGEFQGNSDDKPNYWIMEGDGILHMGGVYPRFYIDDESYKNVEITVYMKRDNTNGKASDGINIGKICGGNGSINGHKSVNNGAGYAITKTYYGRCRFDGGSDLARERHHAGPPYDYGTTYRTWGNGNYRKSKKIFGGGSFPVNQWVGWKFVVNNLKDGDGKKVLLQTWIDLKSGGDKTLMRKENWEMVETLIDEYGKCPCAPSEAYKIFGSSPNEIFTDNGCVLLRTGFADCQYKDLVIQEIKPVKEKCIIMEPAFRINENIIVSYVKNIGKIVGYVVDQFKLMFSR